MNSLLGTIELGRWELGSIANSAPLPGTFTAGMFPDAAVSTSGGTQNTFGAVAGALELGRWQPGQVQAKGFNEISQVGVGTFRAQWFPDVLIIQPEQTGDFTASLYPDAQVTGNLGDLLLVASLFPDALVSGEQHYDAGTFEYSMKPDAIIDGIRNNALVASMYPDLAAFQLAAQEVDCATGPSPAEAFPPANYVF